MLVIAIMLLAVVLAVGVAGLILYVKDLRTRLSNATAELKDAADQLERRTKKAVTSSRTGHVGRIVEQLAPLLPGFPEYNLKDVQWVGGTTDFIVWKGLEDATCQRFPADAQVEIIFMDVKSGNAGLNARQRLIRNAIDANRVYFKTHRFRPDDIAPTSDEDLDLTDEDLELEWASKDEEGGEMILDISLTTENGLLRGRRCCRTRMSEQFYVAWAPDSGEN